MTKGRLEAFSDGVIAIIITITVLLIDLPEGNGWGDLLSILPIVASYFTSFLLVGTNWVNHHHLLQAARTVDGKILWANLFYLFILSFFPVTTGWVGRSGFALVPVQVYIFVNLLGAVSYYLLEKAVMQSKGNTVLKDLIDEPRKERWTIMVEIISFGITFVPGGHHLSCPLLIVAVAPWIVPDLRIKEGLEKNYDRNN